MNIFKKTLIISAFAALSALGATGTGPNPLCNSLIQDPDLTGSYIAWFPMTPLASNGVTSQTVLDCSGNNVSASWSQPNPLYLPINNSSAISGGLFPTYRIPNQSNPNYVDTTVDIPTSFSISTWTQLVFPISFSEPAEAYRIVEFGTFGPVPAQDYPGGFYLGLSTQTPVGANEDGTDLFGGSYQFIVNDANASTVYGSCIGGTADGRPHLLTAVYSGNSLGGIGNLYVDGRKVTGDCHFSFGGLSGVHGRIGTYDNYPSTPKYSNTAYPTFPGVIGDIRYVNFAMTDAQVANLYALTAPSVCAGPAPCTTY